MSPDNIKKITAKLPQKPGIYIFRGAHNKPLYIGKALNLKNRVSHYQKTDDPRLQKMLAEAKKVDSIKTGSDIEALLLESQYIKEYTPPFNIMLRDDKQYFFVGFTDEKFPKLFLTHQPNSKYRNIEISEFIGPFTDGNAIKTTLRLLRKIFPYCTCKQLHNNYCLNYHINKCPGFCCLKDNPERNRRTAEEKSQYQKNIKAIKNILGGKRVSLIKQFGKEMQKLGKEHKFEEALELQNKIDKLKRVFQNAQIIENWKLKIENSSPKQENITLRQLQDILVLNRLPYRIEAYDVANIQGKYAVGAMIVFTDGKPDKNEYRRFKIRSENSPNDTAMLKEILTRRLKHSGMLRTPKPLAKEWPYPDLILIDGGKAQLNTAKSAIYGSSTSIYPQIISLAKNEKHIGEKIYLNNKKEALPLSKLPTEVKNLLLQIDSEAHRFAITYYRKLHREKLKQPVKEL